MKKIRLNAAATALIALAALFLFSLFPAGAAESVVITFEDVSVEYTPEGYMPQAHVNAAGMSGSIQYLAVRTSDSQPVSLPLTQSGEYRVKAFIPATDSSPEISDTATVVITPVKVMVALEYLASAYTSEPVTPPYHILPEWAAEYITIEEEYIYFDKDDPDATRAVEKPLMLGDYLAMFTLGNADGNFSFDGKAFIFTVAEKRGRKQAEALAKQSVDPRMTCEIEDFETVYDGLIHPAVYESYPSVLVPELTYRKIDYSGSTTAATPIAPTEPGEYEVTASLFGTPFSTGTIVISRIVPQFSLETLTYEYNPKGVTPIITDGSVPCSFIAYACDSQGNTTGQVSLPVKELGRYLIVINPTDTLHYEPLYSLSYIDVIQAKAQISTVSQTFIYDGFEKAIAYSVNPLWAECEVRYYTLTSEGKIKTQLGTTPPINVGSYMATVHVRDTVNVEPTSVSVFFKIIPASTAVSAPEVSTDHGFLYIGIASPYFIIIALILPAVLIAVFGIHIFRSKHK